jgi:hypothetical protein
VAVETLVEVAAVPTLGIHTEGWRGRPAVSMKGQWRTAGSAHAREVAGGGGDGGARAQATTAGLIWVREEIQPPTVMTDGTHASM